MKKVLSLISLLLLLCIAVPVQVFAETAEEFEGSRNIYIGDIIILEITAQKFTAEELTEKFRDFEIVELKKESDIWLLSLRTFEYGEYIITLGDKEIVISVKSTLDDIQKDDNNIFEGGKWVIEPGFSFHWRIFFIVSISVFILSLGFIIFKKVFKRKIKMQSPYHIFLERSAALSIENNNYFVNLTLFFKEYLEKLYQCNIIGKTSNEIINELKGLQELDVQLPAIQAWLTECDRLKFTGVIVSNTQKQEHYEKLLDLVKKIHQKNINTQKEGAA